MPEVAGEIRQYPPHEIVLALIHLKEGTLNGHRFAPVGIGNPAPDIAVYRDDLGIHYLSNCITPSNAPRPRPDPTIRRGFHHRDSIPTRNGQLRYCSKKGAPGQGSNGQDINE